MDILTIDPRLTQILSCAPLLRHVEVQFISSIVSNNAAPQTLQALRSIPQSISWHPLTLCLGRPQVQGIALEVCAASAGTPLARAVSKLKLWDWQVEPPIAALHASFPNVLQFELSECYQITASSLSEAVAAWPKLQSISLSMYGYNVQESVQTLQPLEAFLQLLSSCTRGG